MTEKEKMLKGELFLPADETLRAERKKCKSLCFQYNQLSLEQKDKRKNIIRQLFGKCGNRFAIEQSFQCDYGYNISIGENFFANHNLVILDPAPVIFGDNVLIGPNCGFYTPEHPLEVLERNKGLEYAKPIIVGNNVWFGGNVVVLGGVKIGNNCVIGAGSVVVKDIPDNTIVVGNPCCVIKKLEK